MADYEDKAGREIGGDDWDKPTFKLITRENCSYCTQAKNLLENHGHDFEELEIGVDIERADVVEQYPTQTMLPIVLINGELEGGYVDLLDYLNPSLET